MPNQTQMSLNDFECINKPFQNLRNLRIDTPPSYQNLLFSIRRAIVFGIADMFSQNRVRSRHFIGFNYKSGLYTDFRVCQENALFNCVHSVSIYWWAWLDLNQRPIGYEPTALTPELQARESFKRKVIFSWE